MSREFSSGKTICAAEYVRMSTEHQKYSSENQRDIIRDYADKYHMKIVRSYADDGKSGLRIQGRDALKRLIEDVESGNTDFQVILVYDISRWGRFQDADESAYYEYICKNAGIHVHYCAEQFENDGSTASNIIKSVKRSMAGEYSRELSVKVFKGQCKLIEKGFRQGGPAGFGLRRILVDENRQPKCELKQGQYKSFQTDRVILAPGPIEEVKTVNLMYNLFVNDGKNENDIAQILNEKGIKTNLNRAWTRGTVHQILTNEKYIGNNVYNRTSFKLKKKRIKNPPEMWIRSNNVFEPIVDFELFYKAQGMILQRDRRYSNEEMLSKLKQLCQKNGKLSGFIIDETDGMPSSTAYQSRFNGLIRAYNLIGYTPDRDYQYIEINRFIRRMHPEIINNIISGIEASGGDVIRINKKDILMVNNEFSISILIARCWSTFSGSLRWTIRFDTGLEPDITIALRLDPDNKKPIDYYIFPLIDIDNPRLLLADDNRINIDSYRFNNLDIFWKMVKRVKVEAA